AGDGFVGALCLWQATEVLRLGDDDRKAGVSHELLCDGAEGPAFEALASVCADDDEVGVVVDRDLHQRLCGRSGADMNADPWHGTVRAGYGLCEGRRFGDRVLHRVVKARE